MVLGFGGGGGGAPASSPQAWYASLPPVTRIWFTLTLAMTIAFMAGIIAPLSLAHLPQLTFGSLQIWRAVTSFTFLGKFSFSFLMAILMLLQYSSKLETEYEGRTSEYLWVLILGMVTIMIANALVGLELYFMTTPLIFYVLYIWCRRHPAVQMAVFGLFNISAAYLPFFLMLMTSLMGGSIAEMLTGIVIGHLFHYLNDVHPWTSGSSWFKPPEFMRNAIPNADIARPVSGGGAVRGTNYGQGSWAAHQQQNRGLNTNNNNNNNNNNAAPPANNNAGGGMFFRTTGHSWGEGRRLGD